MNFIVPDVATMVVMGVGSVLCGGFIMSTVVKMTWELILLREGVYDTTRYSCFEEAQEKNFAEFCEVFGAILSIMGLVLLMCAVNPDLMSGNLTPPVRP